MKYGNKTKEQLKEFRDSSTYSKYRQYVDTLKILKDELDTLVKEKGEVCTNYQNYLAENPYKEKRKELIKKVKKKKDIILDLVG